MYKLAIQRVTDRYLLKQAGPLTDPSKLRYQAVFMMGAGGSGKGWVAYNWMKYMPGGTPDGIRREQYLQMEVEGFQQKTEEERRLSQLHFEGVQEKVKDMGFRIELVDGGSRAKVPFQLFEYNNQGHGILIDPSDYQKVLTPELYREVKGLSELTFGAPEHEFPSYWRSINPDVYKEQIPGYRPSSPGLVHEMSSQMSKTYFQAVVNSGDPLFADGTGSNFKKMKTWIEYAKQGGYKVTLVLVLVPLTVTQIRNATRPRKVLPMVVTSQWKKIQKNFASLRPLVDKWKVVLNRNDAVDIRNYQRREEEINQFIQKTTKYDSLYQLIQDNQPSEIKDWGNLLS